MYSNTDHQNAILILKQAMLRASFTDLLINTRPDGIYTSEFVGAGHRVIDEWFTYQLFLNNEMPVNSVIRQIFLISDRIPSMPYFLYKARLLWVEASQILCHRIAFVYSRSPYKFFESSRLCKASLPISQITLHCFPQANFALAVNWLLEAE